MKRRRWWRTWRALSATVVVVAAPMVADADAAAAVSEPPSASTVAFPVVVDYAGITWSLTGLREPPVTGDSTTTPIYNQPELLVDIALTNNTPFGMTWPIEALTLRAADGTEFVPDGQVGTGSQRVDLDPSQTVATTLEFDAERFPNPVDLSMVIATTGHIPEVVPFTGAPAPIYPIDVNFAGTTGALPLEGDDTATVSAGAATVDIDAPSVRASVGHRLLVLEVSLTAPSTNRGDINIDEKDYSLDVAGELLAPVVLVEWVPNSAGFYPQVVPGGTEQFTLVFEIDPAVSTAALVIDGRAIDGDSDAARLPIELPPMPTPE